VNMVGRRDRGRHTHELLRLERRPASRAYVLSPVLLPYITPQQLILVRWGRVLSSDLGYVLVDAVQSLCSSAFRSTYEEYGVSYFEHDYGVATDNYHAYRDLLAACLLLQRIVEDNVQVDL
jgi:hypothetical protein